MYAYIYEQGNGKIIREISTSTEEMLLYNIETGDNYVVSEEPCNAEDTYVLNGVLTPRPSFSLALSKNTITANGTDKANLTGVPSGATVTLGEQSFAVDDGEADIEGYTGIVKITCWPYLDAEVTL